MPFLWLFLYALLSLSAVHCNRLEVDAIDDIEVGEATGDKEMKTEVALAEKNVRNVQANVHNVQAKENTIADDVDPVSAKNTIEDDVDPVSVPPPVNCDPKRLATKSKFEGMGANAYVISLTQDECGGSRGDALKAFKSFKERDGFLNTLAALPAAGTCGLAGLACTAENKHECAINTNCVNCAFKIDQMGRKVAPLNRGDPQTVCANFRPQQMCYFARMVSGGDRTLLDCLVSAKANAKFPNVMNLMIAAVERLRCIHAEGYIHGDYQTKNVMTYTCNPDSVKVVDLDFMAHKDSQNLNWPAPVCAWHDYCLLFGSCARGGQFLETIKKTVRGMNTTIELQQAARLRDIRSAAERVLPSYKSIEGSSWDDVTDMNDGLGARILASLAELDKPKASTSRVRKL